MIDVPKTREALARALQYLQVAASNMSYLDTKAKIANDADTLRALSAALGQAQTGLFVNEAGQHVRGIWLPADATADEVTK